MSHIEIETAMGLTGLGRRTLWRRMALGQLSHKKMKRGRGQARTLLDLEEVLKLTDLPLSANDATLIAQADGGNPDAQCELGLMLLPCGTPERALPWLRCAAENDSADAQHWLARCYANGKSGVEQDETQALIWLTRAAKAGHAIAQRQLAALASAVGDPAVPSR